jgi:hypothetical protein
VVVVLVLVLVGSGVVVVLDGSDVVVLVVSTTCTGQHGVVVVVGSAVVLDGSAVVVVVGAGEEVVADPQESVSSVHSSDAFATHLHWPVHSGSSQGTVVVVVGSAVVVVVGSSVVVVTSKQGSVSSTRAVCSQSASGAGETIGIGPDSQDSRTHESGTTVANRWPRSTKQTRASEAPETAALPVAPSPPCQASGSCRIA